MIAQDKPPLGVSVSLAVSFSLMALTINAVSLSGRVVVVSIFRLILGSRVMPHPSEFLRAVTFSQVWEESMSKPVILEEKGLCVKKTVDLA